MLVVVELGLRREEVRAWKREEEEEEELGLRMGEEVVVQGLRREEEPAWKSTRS